MSLALFQSHALNVKLRGGSCSLKSKASLPYACSALLLPHAALLSCEPAVAVVRRVLGCEKDHSAVLQLGYCVPAASCALPEGGMLLGCS